MGNGGMLLFFAFSAWLSWKLTSVLYSLPLSLTVAGKHLQSVTSSVSDREKSQLEILSLQVALVVRVCECRMPHKQTLRSFFRSGLSPSPRPVHNRLTRLK